VPGFVTTGILFAGMGAAAGVAEDLEQGFFDRLRSLPIPARRCWPAAAIVVVFGLVAALRFARR
jgi:hypothetical protein